jgi:hypothetical protein
LTDDEAKKIAIATKEVHRHFPGSIPIDPKWLALGTLGAVLGKTYRPRVKQMLTKPATQPTTPPPPQQRPPAPADAMPPQPADPNWEWGLGPSHSSATH